MGDAQEAWEKWLDPSKRRIAKDQLSFLREMFMHSYRAALTDAAEDSLGQCFCASSDDGDKCALPAHRWLRARAAQAELDANSAARQPDVQVVREVGGDA